MYFSDGGHETKQFGLIAHGLNLQCSNVHHGVEMAHYYVVMALKYITAQKQIYI